MEKETPTLLGYCIMRNHKYEVGTPTPNGVKWEKTQTGFKLEFMKKKLYSTKGVALEAVTQLKQFDADDEFEVHPVFWYGRN